MSSVCLGGLQSALTNELSTRICVRVIIFQRLLFDLLFVEVSPEHLYVKGATYPQFALTNISLHKPTYALLMDN